MGLIDACSIWPKATHLGTQSGRLQIWCGRIGMVLAFIGGLMGIIDIVGAEKIGVLEESGRIIRA